MNAVIYARYSSDNQREESIEGQLRECKEFAERNGMTIVGEYIDRAKSATTANRPEFQHMIAESSKHAFEIIIVWKLDRFARNRYDSAHYKSILRKNGVKVISATETISEGAEGVLLESMLEGMAEYYSKELGEKTLRGMTENALKCKHNGGLCPLGFTVDENLNYIVDEQYAPIVLEAFNMYDNGTTIQQIAADFNARGLKTQRGKKISINCITNMLHNRKYIGEYKFKDVVVPGGMPAIVPESLFLRVQERMVMNKKAPSHYKADCEYLLTTKLFCGKCGRIMAGESGTNRNGVKYRYYKCVGVKYHYGCDKKTIKKERIEDFVIDRIMKIVNNPEAINEIIKNVLIYQEKGNRVLPMLEAELADVEKRKANLLNAIEMGIVNATTKQRLDELEMQCNNLQIEIAREQMEINLIDENKLRFYLEQFKGIDPTKLSNRRKLINTFVNAIYLYDDKLDLILNYQDGTQTIPLSEVEAFSNCSPVICKGEPYGTHPKIFQTGNTFGCVIFLLNQYA
ncbi:MAG: recombinase family protein [Candidatus Gastranaerophilaceae bacterium]